MLGLLISFMTCVDCKQNNRPIPQDRRCVYCGGKLSAREDAIWPEEWERKKAKMLKDFGQWKERDVRERLK